MAYANSVSSAPSASPFNSLYGSVEDLEKSRDRLLMLVERIVGPQPSELKGASLSQVGPSGVMGTISDNADRIYSVTAAINSAISRVESMLP